MSAEFEGWAILELLGHRKLAGYVRKATVAGAPMLRIDIPCEPPVTQYYAATALYGITPTTEELARAAAKVSRPTPIHRYELPPAPGSDGSDEDKQPVDLDDDVRF